MKRVLALLLAFPVLGCDPHYPAEKALWHGRRGLSDIRKNPEGSPEGLFRTVREHLEKVSRLVPGDPKDAEARLSLGELSLLQARYDEAVRIFNEGAAVFADVPDVAAKMKFAAGRTFEQKGDWAAAMEVYRSLIDQVPPTPSTLDVPLYVARALAAAGKEKEARDAYADAAARYDGASVRYEGSPAGLAALERLAAVYGDLQEKSGFMSALERVLASYPGSQAAERAEKILAEMRSENG